MRKEEIIYYNKRYRIHNNYLSVGPGYLFSSIRDNAQKSLGLDFHFHIRNQQLQGGLMMSGEGFRSNNNIGAHCGYGYRKETLTYNLGTYIGLSYNNGIRTIKDSTGAAISGKYYEGFGIYVSAKAITKLTYDFGVGAEIFSEITSSQSLIGIRLIAFFSGAYMGPKKTFNPNVRLESKQ